MQLQHEFTLPIPPEQAWTTLLDVERVAPCMPGALLDRVDGDEFSGRMTLKMGPLRLTYRGIARIQDRDEQARRVVIAADGQEARGSGSAQATVTATLSDADGGTRVALATDLVLSGRPAQFGRGLVNDVAGTVISQFADRLADEMTRDGEAPDMLTDAPRAGRTAEHEDTTAAADGRRSARSPGASTGHTAAAGDNSLDALALLRTTVGARGLLALAGAAGMAIAFVLGRASRRRAVPLSGHPGGWPAVVVVDAGEK